MDWLDGIEAHWLWITLGFLLAALEMLVPGVYLIWFAMAALTTGLIVFATDPGLALQLVYFVALALLFAFGAKRWLHDSPLESSDPLMNQRGQRLVGETAVVVLAIEGGNGRIKLGDSEWNVRGPDLAAGERVRITGNDGATLLVEKV